MIDIYDMNIPALMTIYLVVVNVLSFSLFGIDKYKAKHKKWRISEKTLFISAVLGGSIGAFIGMHFFHHKTKHLYFLIGIPVILAIQIK